MLSRSYRNFILSNIIALFHTSVKNIRKTLSRLLRSHCRKCNINVVRAKLFHFLNNCVCYNVSRLKFVSKSFPVFVKKNCALAPYAFADKKTSAFLLAVKSGRVYLNIINVFKLYPVLNCKRK